MTKSVFKVTIVDNAELQEYKDKAMHELNEFFEKRWVFNTPKLFIVDDRKTIDLLKEEKTEDYVIGWGWENAVFILNPKNISKESCHGRELNIKKFVKHELCHSFFKKIFGEFSKFMWINEGISLYVAGQLEDYDEPKKFDGFLVRMRIMSFKNQVM